MQVKEKLPMSKMNTQWCQFMTIICFLMTTFTMEDTSMPYIVSKFNTSGSFQYLCCLNYKLYSPLNRIHSVSVPLKIRQEVNNHAA